MCEYLSAIVTRTGKIYTATDTDSHEELIRRAGLRDGEQHMRHWVRVECPPPHRVVKVDERGTLPGWYEDEREDIEDRIRAYAEAEAPASKAYDEAEATASKAYDEAVATARKAYDEAAGNIAASHGVTLLRRPSDA